MSKNFVPLVKYEKINGMATISITGTQKEISIFLRNGFLRDAEAKLLELVEADKK